MAYNIALNFEDGVTRFIATEAHRYGIAQEEPLELHLYPALSEAPRCWRRRPVSAPAYSGA